MGALAQAVATGLGDLGGAAGAAREAQTAANNKLAQDQADNALALRQFLEKEQMDRLSAQIQQANLALAQSKAAGQNVVDFGSFQGGDGKWYRLTHDLGTGTTNKIPLPGPPESVVKTAETEADIDARDKAQEQLRQQDRMDLAQLVASLRNQSDNPMSDGDYADAIQDGSMLITQVPSKNRGGVLAEIKKRGSSLPAQISPALRDKLDQRSMALTNAIQVVDDIQKNADLLQNIPTAALTDLAASGNSVKAMLYRKIKTWYPEFLSSQADKDKYNAETMRIEELASDLDELHEFINNIRGPLGATAFRGVQGFDTLQDAGLAKALVAPGVSTKNLETVKGLMQGLLDSTNRELGPKPLGTGAGSPSGGPDLIIVSPSDMGGVH